MTSLEKIEALITAIGYYSTVETGYGLSIEEVLKRSGIADKYCLINYDSYSVNGYYENEKIQIDNETMQVYYKTIKADTLTQQNNLISALDGKVFTDDFSDTRISKVMSGIALNDDTNHIWMMLNITVE